MTIARPLSSIDAYKELIRHISELVSAGQEIYHLYPQNPLIAHRWTVLKLVFLKLYVPIYTWIIKRRYSYMAYLDLFAGSGLNVFEGYEKAPIPGSPIIAWGFAGLSFDHLYLVEKNGDHSRSLQHRIKLVVPSTRFTIYHKGDANEKVYDIMDEIEEFSGAHYMAFIDPFGLNVHWSTMERLLSSKVRGDLLILFQSHVAMTTAKQVLKREARSKALPRLFGTHDWLDYLKKKMKNGSAQEVEDLLLEYYIMRIRSVRKKARILTVNIRLYREHISYKLIFVTTKTRQNNPWMKNVFALKSFIENARPEDVDNGIKNALGKPKSLVEFL